MEVLFVGATGGTWDGVGDGQWGMWVGYGGWIGHSLCLCGDAGNAGHAGDVVVRGCGEVGRWWGGGSVVAAGGRLIGGFA